VLKKGGDQYEETGLAMVQRGVQGNCVIKKESTLEGGGEGGYSGTNINQEEVSGKGLQETGGEGVRNELGKEGGRVSLLDGRAIFGKMKNRGRDGISSTREDKGGEKAKELGGIRG